MEDEKDKEQHKPRAFETLEERLARKRKKASPSVLIMYVITLIIAIIILLWLRGFGK